MPSSGVPRLEYLLNECADGRSGMLLHMSIDSPPALLSYKELRETASANANDLLHRYGVSPGRIILVHFADHRENVIWFWTSILAGCVPAMSTPLVKNKHGRLSHLQHLQKLLLNPIVVTSRESIENDFGEQSLFRILAVSPEADKLEEYHGPVKSSAAVQNNADGNRLDEGHLSLPYKSEASPLPSLDDVAALMLTSGSTGNAKAVCLTHEQILLACKGKLSHMPLPKEAMVLNWIGLDHVGSLVELHLTAMVAGCSQIHVPAADVVANPIQYLRLLSQHGVVRTFAPNFFLHRLLQNLDATRPHDLTGIDLHRLLYLISGGEPNDVDTCVRLSEHLHALGASSTTTIVPGFGMTETCAGSIYSRLCPLVDVEAGAEFASLGTCVPGIEMRVKPMGENINNGSLQVRGPIVFQRYFNNTQATEEAFTHDGWFQTGDVANIDRNGFLWLSGRSKQLININGVKFLPQEIESALEREQIAGVEPSSFVCFDHRAEHAQTEHIYVVYQHRYKANDWKTRARVMQAISSTVTLFASARPQILPLPSGRLARTSLGKLSRSKIRASLLGGEYQDQVDLNLQMLERHHTEATIEPLTANEERLAQIFVTHGFVLRNIDSTILDSGVSSVDLISLKRAAEKAFDIQDIPVITPMVNSTISTLAAALQTLMVDSHHKIEYNPVVTLQAGGSKAPLWLMHPGIGEMLVFLGLAKYFPDRPVYAMRARGLNPGEKPFSGLEEVISCYHSAIKAKQPSGPYALAGYSYGSMLAFEIAKLLEKETPGCVQFLASFNLPPHIKTRMRRLDWTAGMVHIAHFCGIITEERSEQLADELRTLPHNAQVAKLLIESDQDRCAELALTHAGLVNWVDVSWSLQKIGWEYEPSGEVPHMDIFYCQPLKDVASTRKEYRKDHLNHWVDFIRDDLKFWEVEGKHYTMIGPELVPKFQETLRGAIAARGL